VPLSVLSALARLDIDPWLEVAELARLPGETATLRLASLIAALPDWRSGHLDPRTIAAQLIALLPRRARFGIPSREALLNVGTATNSRAVGTQHLERAPHLCAAQKPLCLHGVVEEMVRLDTLRKRVGGGLRLLGTPNSRRLGLNRRAY